MHVDRPKIHVVLRNMVSNAIKFSPADSRVLVTVDPVKNYDPEGRRSDPRRDRVCSLAEGSHIRVSVKDDGAGISESNQMLMFGNIVQVE